MLVAEETEAAQVGIEVLVPGIAELWAETTGDRRVCVAILDGPIDLNHPAFAGADLTCVDTIAAVAPDTGLATRHGTHVASIVFGRHEGPVRGVAPGCR